MAMHANKYLSGAKSWPFEEARKIVSGLQNPLGKKKDTIILETGYGPSGLPHIGTFGEVLRTTMVMNAFRLLSEIPARIFVFSDDMDGFRKVPSNVPNQAMLTGNLEKPLTSVPDPFGKYESFAHHNNAMLCRFLDSFGFEYEFKSSTKLYKTGVFNECLKSILKNYDNIMDIMLPSLRDERQKTYSPILPICKRTGRVLQVPIKEIHLERSSIVYEDPQTNEIIEISILDGNCKLQWKADWGMRWITLGVDYEMNGKDLIESFKLSSRIANVIGGVPPENMTYELFLDDEGKKISKSKGNGLSMEDWLKYAPTESLSYYMFQAPKRAKRLFFDVIPSAMDDYIDALERFRNDADSTKLDNPVFHIHNGKPPVYEGCLKFSLMLNLVQSCNTSDANILMKFAEKYLKDASEETVDFVKKLAKFAIVYYNDFVAGTRIPKAPDEQRKAELLELRNALKNEIKNDASADELQHLVFEVGKKFYEKNELKAWFKLIYNVLFGTESGPKIGSFVFLYGIENTVALIERRAQI
ncbi:lysine--tRNA ligase [Alphaproteobacteria bacterium]|nr:lysine--tRNA ligase [Alphaproteobacteria bacterium]